MLIDPSPLWIEYDDNDYYVDVPQMLYDIIGGFGSDTVIDICRGTDVLDVVEYRLTGSSTYRKGHTFDSWDDDFSYNYFLEFSNDAANDFEREHPDIVALYQDPIGYVDEHSEYIM